MIILNTISNFLSGNLILILILILILKILQKIILFSVSKNQIPLVWQACKILLVYLVGKLPQNQTQPGDGSSTILTTKQLLLAIRSLCVGQSLLVKTEEVALVTILRNAKLPSSATTTTTTTGTGTGTGTTTPLSTNGEKESNQQHIKEAKRSRSDLSSNILEQLTMPLQEFIPSLSARIDVTSDGTKLPENVSNEQASDIKVFFLLFEITL